MVMTGCGKDKSYEDKTTFLLVSIPYGKGKVMGPEEEDPTTTKYQFPMGKVKILKRWELS